MIVNFLRCFCPCPVIEPLKKEKTEMSAPIDRTPTMNPYSNKPLSEGDLVVDTKETAWFRNKVEECKKEGIDTDYMERTLNTAVKYNEEIYKRKIEEDAAEKKRREGKEGNCLTQ